MKSILPKYKSSKGFTLIELLVVVTIIAILAVVVFVALNPAKRIKDANDARRTTDVDSILTAIHTYAIDNNGTLPTGLSAGTAETQIGAGLTGCDALAACTTDGACIDLYTAGGLDKYLKSMPIDPIGGSTYDADKTGYTVEVDANGIVTVKACGTQGATIISSSR